MLIAFVLLQTNLLASGAVNFSYRIFLEFI